MKSNPKPISEYQNFDSAMGRVLQVSKAELQRRMAEGVGLLHAVQDVFLDDSITIA